MATELMRHHVYNIQTGDIYSNHVEMTKRETKNDRKKIEWIEMKWSENVNKDTHTHTHTHTHKS